MQGWMIALIILACVIAFIAVAFLIGSLVAVHIILGRRKPRRADNNNNAQRYGINMSWFNGVKDVSKTLALTAYDGVKLSATLIKQQSHSDRVAVCCHGYGSCERDMQVQAKLFYDRGFDVLLPSMRGHGKSGGKVGVAWIDRFDLLRWIDKLIEVYGENVNIALCGISMGGSTVIAAAGMNPPSQVKCVINDCGFSSQKDVYSSRVKFPALALLPLAAGVKLVHGYSIGDADITALAKNMTMPALFIHGDADKFVPYALGEKLFNACASIDKQLLTIEGAGHALAYAADTQKYTDAFNAFVDKHIQGSEFVFDSDTLIPQQQEEEKAPTADTETPNEEPANNVAENETVGPDENSTDTVAPASDTAEPATEKSESEGD